MNLPFTVSPNITSRNYYFSLEIGSAVLQTSIWTVENRKVQVLSVGTHEKFHHLSDFVAAADKSLTQSALSQKIDPVSIKNVILGLPSSWLSQEKILPERAKFLKEVCHKLSLKPIGFVITAESIIQFIHHTEGVPPTAIFIGISGDELEVSMVRLGKIYGIHTVKRGQNIIEDVKEGLSRFLPADLFPSRILLYDHGVELETIRQTLLGYSWQSGSNRLPFLHFPKIDILPANTSIKAISTTTGADAVANQISSRTISPAVKVEPQVDSSGLSFVEDIDLAIHKSAPPSAVSVPAKTKFRPKITLPRLPGLPRLPRFFGIVPGLLVLILISLPVFAWYRFAKAEIYISIVPQTISVRFSTTASLKQGEPVSLKSTSTELDTEINLPTTGTALVGDKATGQVTVINGTNLPKTFPAGTLLTSPSQLKFETTADVTVSPASGSADPNSYQPGKADVSIIAQAIGQDSNLSAGTEFRIGSFSALDFTAKNSSAFSGGSSRQTQAVARKDITDAKSQADSDLNTKSEVALKSGLPQDSVIIPESLSIQTLSETTNFDEGQAAEQLTLNRKVKASALYYLQTDLDNLVESKLSPEYPENPKLLSTPKTEITFRSQGTNAYQVNITASVDLAADIDTDRIISQLPGKPVTKIRPYFSSLPGYTDFKVEFTPKIFASVKILPLRRDNLSVFTTFVSP